MSRPSPSSAAEGDGDDGVMLVAIDQGDVDPGVAAVARSLVLIREFSAHATTSAIRACRVDDVSNSELAVLIRLAASDGLQPRDLRADIPLTSGGMANLLGRLEAQGLIVRGRPASGDQRAVHVALTSRGREHQGRLSRSMAASLGLDASVIKEIIELLESAGFAPADIERPPAPDTAGRITLGLARLGVVLAEALETVDREPDSISRTIALAALLEGPLRPGRLADLLSVTSGGASRLVDRLEHDELVVRDTGGDERDARSVLVRITAAGSERVRARVRQIEPYLGELLTILRSTLDDLPSALAD